MLNKAPHLSCNRPSEQTPGPSVAVCGASILDLEGWRHGRRRRSRQCGGMTGRGSGITVGENKQSISFDPKKVVLSPRWQDERQVQGLEGLSPAHHGTERGRVARRVTGVTLGVVRRNRI
nr:unnamed protein product [Digitaria exilis]